MIEAFIDVTLDTFIDSIKLVPFLFLTYLTMEYLEHKTSEKTENMIKKAGKFGPLIGGIVGVVPQCGFSAAASGLYAGRVITMGTLIAIFLSTSDEMLPILISENVGLAPIMKILLIKIVIGVIAGFIIDFIFHNKIQKNTYEKQQVCEHEHCDCEHGIVMAAVKHTLQITFFIIIISFILNLVIQFVGEEALAGLILNRPILGQLVAGAVGLIPNCASSVVITRLYLEGAMSLGAMMSGLLVGAGIGILVLFKANRNKKENFKIMGMLYVIGVCSGIVIEWLKIQI